MKNVPVFQALLFDCLHMRDPVTLAYNSAHVPPLFDYKESMAFPGALQQALAAQAAAKAATPAATQQPGTSAAPPTKQEQGTEPTGAPAAEGAEVKPEPGSAATKEGSGEAPAEKSAKAKGDVPMQEAAQEKSKERSGDNTKQISGSTGTGSKKEPKLVLDIDLPESLKNTFTEHLEFLKKQNSLRSDSLVRDQFSLLY